MGCGRRHLHTHQRINKFLVGTGNLRPEPVKGRLMDEILVVGKGVHDDGALDLGQHFVSVTEAEGIARAQAEHSNSARWEPGCRCPGSRHYLARNAGADRCASELRTDDPTVIDDRHDSTLVGHRPHLVSRGLAPKQQEQYPLALPSAESMSSCTTLSVGETTARRRPDGQRDTGLNRSRRGTGPISTRNSTDLGEGDGRARAPFSAGSYLGRRELAERRETPGLDHLERLIPWECGRRGQRRLRSAT